MVSKLSDVTFYYVVLSKCTVDTRIAIVSVVSTAAWKRIWLSIKL